MTDLPDRGVDSPSENLKQSVTPEPRLADIVFSGADRPAGAEDLGDLGAKPLGQVLPEETPEPDEILPWSPETTVEQRPSTRVEMPDGAAQSVPGAYPLPDASGIMTEIRGKVNDAVAEYVTDKVEEKVLDKIWALWGVPAEDGLAGVAESVGSLEKDIHILVIFDPSKKILSGFGFPDANLLSSILQEAPIDSVDAPLGQLKQWIQIGGIVIGAFSGHPALAYACFKDLMRDFVREIIVSEIKGGLSDNDSKTPNIATSVPGGRTDSPDSSARSLNEETAPRRGTIHVQEQEAATLKDQEVAQERQQQEAAPWGRWPQEATPGRQEYAVTRGRGRGARTLDDAAATKSLARRRAMDIQEGREHSTSGGLHPGSGAPSSAWPSPSDPRQFTFVHLRIHYATVEPVSAADGLAEPARLTRLVVEHESSALGKVRYLWEARGEGALVLDSLTANALRNDLRRTLSGGPLDLGNLNLVIQEISASSVDQFLEGAMGCVEVIEVLTGGMSERTTLACVGFKTLRHDDFCRIVVAAINDLNTDNRH